MVKTAPEDLLKKRMKHLPVAIDSTLSKLQRLFEEAEEYRLPIDVNASARFDELRSRFLTDTKLIDAHWDKVIQDARQYNRG